MQGGALTPASLQPFLFHRAKLETKDPLGFPGPLDPRYVMPHFSVWLQLGLGLVPGKLRPRDGERLALGHAGYER